MKWKIWQKLSKEVILINNKSNDDKDNDKNNGINGNNKYIYLGVNLFLGAIFRKRCFPCDISMELPSRCESCLLSHISHLTETHQNCFHICI